MNEKIEYLKKYLNNKDMDVAVKELESGVPVQYIVGNDRYFCHIEHENCPRKERHDHWHKRESDRRHLRNTANHKRHHSIDERKDTNRYKVPCFQLLRICF